MGPTGTSSVSREHAAVLPLQGGSLSLQDKSSFGTFRHFGAERFADVDAKHRKASSGSPIAGGLKGQGWAPEAGDKTPWYLLSANTDLKLSLLPIAVSYTHLTLPTICSV